MMWVVDLGYNLYIYTEASNRAYGYVVLRGLAYYVILNMFSHNTETGLHFEQIPLYTYVGNFTMHFSHATNISRPLL
jgi:hypothetical protein